MFTVSRSKLTLYEKDCCNKPCIIKQNYIASPKRHGYVWLKLVLLLSNLSWSQFRGRLEWKNSQNLQFQKSCIEYGVALAYFVPQVLADGNIELGRGNMISEWWWIFASTMFHLNLWALKFPSLLLVVPRKTFQFKPLCNPVDYVHCSTLSSNVCALSMYPKNLSSKDCMTLWCSRVKECPK